MKLYGILIVFLANVFIVCPSLAQVDSAKFDLGETCPNCLTDTDYLMALVDYRSEIVQKYNPYLHNTEHFSYFSSHFIAYAYSLSDQYVDTIEMEHSSLDEILNPEFQNDIGYATPGFKSYSEQENKKRIKELALVYDSLNLEQTLLAVREAYPLLLGLVVDLEWPLKLQLKENPIHEELAAYQIKSTDVVGDIGTGSGLLLNLFSRLNVKCYGTEVGAMYALLNKHFDYFIPAYVKEDITLVKAKKKECKLPERSCDVLLLRKSYHHFSHAEKQLASMKLALKPNGRILVVDGYSDMEKTIPQESSGTDPFPGCQKKLTYQRHLDEFVAAGYRLERSEHLPSGLYLTEWKVK